MTFSFEGLESLRHFALENKPWTHSTGPRTPEGKAKCAQNALKHGRTTAQAIRQRRLQNARRKWARTSLLIMAWDARLQYQAAGFKPSGGDAWTRIKHVRVADRPFYAARMSARWARAVVKYTDDKAEVEEYSEWIESVERWLAEHLSAMIAPK